MTVVPFKNHRKAAGALGAVLLAAAVVSAPCAPLAAAGFPDMADQPAEIQAAVDYVTEMGYMKGATDGGFHPAEPVSRIDYARAVVRLYRHLKEELDPNIVFPDLKRTDPGFKYANLAVKHGYLRTYKDGSFRCGNAVRTVDALSGLVVGLEMDSPVTHLNGLFPGGPSYQGHLIVAHDLHLKFRKSRRWPGDEYPRGEMAYSLNMVDKLEDWRVDYVKESFDWLNCQSPLVGPERHKALDAAFSKIGAPYVWAGESDKEGGFDCSGLTYHALAGVLGYPMKRTADDQARDDRYATLRRKELLAGDPIFFYSGVTGDPSARIGHAALYVGQGLFIHSTGSNAGVSVDRLTGYWGEHFAWGKRVIAEPEPESFDTYILLCNPGGRSAAARLTYMLPTGQSFRKEVRLKPYSRRTVRVDDTLVNQEVATTVEVIRGELIAERSMYFRYRGRYPGGHVSPGVTAPSTEWYLAEGCTGGGFDTFLLIANPGERPARAAVSYMRSDGAVVEREYFVNPFSRCTVAVDSVPGMGEAEFSTRVLSDRPVTVERSMYFDYRGVRDGHNSPALPALQNEWYFAEGYTGGGFDTYVLLMNPCDGAADVNIDLLASEGENARIKINMPPHSRRTVCVDSIEGWGDREFSIDVQSPAAGIAAERAVYFSYGGIAGGHDALGSPACSREWYLAEGYTAQGFDTYVLFGNPGERDASVEVRYMLNGGKNHRERYTVPARSRFTVCVDNVDGLAGQEVSACVSSTEPIVVERSMYFRYGRVEGGSCAPGVPAPAPAWYFAEGYTGL